MSSLKELHDRYPKAVFPTIWRRIEDLIVDGSIHSHIEVQREIKNTTDPSDKVLKWSNKYKRIFLDVDDCQTSQLNNIQEKYEVGFWNNQINRPGPWADPYIIALAICERAIIITQENKVRPNRIPPIASQFGIQSLNLLELFQALKIKI